MALNYRSKLFGGGPGGGGGSGTPGGADTQVQFNDGGSFGGDAGLVYNKTTDTLTAGNVTASNLTSGYIPKAGTAGLLGNSTMTETAEVLGADIVTNGSFTGGTTGWTLGAGWAYGTNNIVHGSDGTGTVTQTASLAAVLGTTYKISITISGWSTGSVYLLYGGMRTQTFAADGTYTVYITATSTAAFSIQTFPTGTRLTVDDVSVKAVTAGGIYTAQPISAQYLELSGPGASPSRVRLLAEGYGTAGKAKLYFRDPTGSAPELVCSGITSDGSILGSSFSSNTALFQFNSSGGSLASGKYFAWTSSASDATTGFDTFLTRGGAAATLQLGAAAAAAPVGQRLQAQGAVGTNLSGADLIVAGGGGTGLANTTAAGRRGDYKIRTQVRGTTGTTADTTGTDRIVAAGQVVVLTESSATPILDYGVASGTVAGGTVFYTIRADDATDFQALRGQLQWSAVNKGGTLTASVAIVGSETTAVSSGTLTNTATITTGTNSITINLNAVSSLTQTTLYAYVSGLSDGTGVWTTK